MQRFFLSPVDDKPLKYQHILGIVNVTLASTIDAIPCFDFDLDRFRSCLAAHRS